MMIAKQQIFELVKDLPDELDIDEIMYRLYVRQKLETAEKDVRRGGLFRLKKSLGRLLNGLKNKVDNKSQTFPTFQPFKHSDRMTGFTG